MHVTGKWKEASLDLSGRLILSFEINEKDKALEELHAIKELERLKIDVVKYRHKRSLDANAYFWQLCDKIAKRLGSDKWTIYLLQLSKYGVFVDVSVIREALPMLEREFRNTEILREMEWKGKAGYLVRCYYGSSDYDSKEMSELIEGTVNEAKELGIETLTPDELESMIEAMRVQEKRKKHGV